MGTITTGGLVSKNYNDIIITAVVAASGVGMGTAFAPGADIALVSGTWITMMGAIADRSGHQENKEFWGKVVASVGLGAAGYWGGSKLFTGILFYVVPGAGSLASASINGLLNGLYTWRLGTAFSHLFDKSGVDLHDAKQVAIFLRSAIAPVPTLGEVRHVWEIIQDHK